MGIPSAVADIAAELIRQSKEEKCKEEIVRQLKGLADENEQVLEVAR